MQEVLEGFHDLFCGRYYFFSDLAFEGNIFHLDQKIGFLCYQFQDTRLFKRMYEDLYRIIKFILFLQDLSDNTEGFNILNPGLL